MATQTTNYGLRKPATTDYVNVQTDLNDNYDIIDSALHDIDFSVNANTAKIEQNTADIDALENNFSALTSSGSWTPTVSRATVSNASGKWYKIGDIVFLQVTIAFGSSQTDSGNLYIDSASLPSAITSSNVNIHGGGATGTYSYGLSNFANKNIWITRIGVGRIQASTVAGETIYFSATVVPR